MNRIINFSLSICILTMASSACNRAPYEGFTVEEAALINSADSTMRVLTVRDSSDLEILRRISTELPAQALLSDEFSRLSELMIATVTDPSQDGVGIAGPQVGINRRIVAVQRFDKEPVMKEGKKTYPFEIYPNINIIWASDSLVCSPEGCLSVPDMTGNVMRSTELIIEYTDLTRINEISSEELPTVRDTISGFTAIIFQHETDHLEGILYTDRIMNEDI